MGDETVSEKKRCVIVGGADIGDYARVKQYLRADDAIVFCDSGLKHMEALGVKPALIVGDFDSHCNPHLDVETIVLPCEKDDTDTVFAVKTMVQRGYDDFLLIGVIGARLDHTLGNVSILLYLDSLGKKAEIVDDYSEMQIVSKDEVSIEDKYPFFSLLNITGCARGITIREVPARRRGDHVRIPVRREQRGPARKDRENLRAGWKAPAYQNLQTVSETKKAADRRPAAFCCVWIVISRWERRQETACRCHPRFQGTRRTS